MFTFDRLPDFLLYTPPPHSPNCLHKPLSKFTNPQSQRGSSYARSCQPSKRNHFPFAKMSSQTPLDVYESVIIKGKQLCKELASFEAQPPLPASLASCGYEVESGRLNSNTENSLRLPLLSCGVLISNSKKTLTAREFGRQRCSGNAGRAKHWKLKSALQICAQLCVCASSVMHRRLPFGKLHSIRHFQESTNTTRSSTPVKTMVFTPFWDLRTGRTRCECFVTTGQSWVTASSTLRWKCQRLGVW
jgi:hypothetical protein